MTSCLDKRVDKRVDSIEENNESPSNFHAGYRAHHYP